MDIRRQVLQEQGGTEIKENNMKVSHVSQDSLGGQDKQLSRMTGQSSSRGQVTVCKVGTPGIIWVTNWDQEHQAKKPGNKELGPQQGIKKGLSKVSNQRTAQLQGQLKNK